MDNLFNSQTVPVTKADIENAGLDSSNCINAQHITANSITRDLKGKLYRSLPANDPDNGYEGCYISSEPGADEVDTSIKVIDKTGVQEGYILHTSDIAHLKTTPFNKLLKNMVNSLLLTVLIAIIICASSFWLNYSNYITINADGECNAYLGEKKHDLVKLIDYLFPSNLWNWPYYECVIKQSGGGFNYDEKNIKVNNNINESVDTNIGEIAKNNNVFPYSFLRNLEDDYKDYHVLKVIPKYSLTLVLCIMLVYRKIVKFIIKKGMSLNQSLKGNPIGKLLIIVLSILSFTTMLGLINNFIIPGISIIILGVILFKHLYDLSLIIQASIEGNKKTVTKRFSIAFVGAIITGILMLIFHLGDIKEDDSGLGFYAAAFASYFISTYIFGNLVAGTFAIILFAILAVVITNNMRAKATKEANEFYTPRFTKYRDFFKYNTITKNDVNFVKTATSLPRNHRDAFVYMNSDVEQKYQALDFSITKKKDNSSGRNDAYIYEDNSNNILNDSSMVELLDTIRTTYVIDAKDKNVDIEWLQE